MGGDDGWLGADLSQLEQAALFLEMSANMPGQYTLFMARAVIPVVPWWEACNTTKVSDCKDVGIATLSPYNTTGQMVESSDLTL